MKYLKFFSILISGLILFIFSEQSVAQGRLKLPPRPAGEIGCYNSAAKKWDCSYCTDDAMRKRNYCSSRGGIVALQTECDRNNQDDELVSNGTDEGDCRKKQTDSTRQLTASEEAIKTQCIGKGGKPAFNDDHEIVCECNDGSGRIFSETNCGTRPATAQTQQDANQFQCSDLNDFISSARKCEADGGEAVAQCNKDQKGINENFDAAQSIIGVMSQAALAKGAQAGSAESCFNTGAINAGAFYALNGLKETCEKEQDECRQGCSIARGEVDRVIEACTAKYKAAHNFSSEYSTQVEQLKFTDYMTYLHNKITEFRGVMNSGIKKCEIDAKKNSSDLQNLMSNMDRAAKQAAICNCQLSAGGTNCPQMPGPADCLKDPTNPLCKNIPPNCTGADRDSKQCICLRDPKAASCAVAGPNTGSQVAAPGVFQPISGASPNYKSSTGGGINLGDLGGDEMAAASASADRSGGGDPIGSVAPGGGGGGGGGAGGGGADKEVAEGEHESKSGIGGLFNQLKTGVSQLFGGGKKDASAGGKTYGDGKNKNGLDPEKWRPKGGLRGIAGGNGIGGRNEDIFKKMNNQYNQQYHTFITGEKSPR